MLKEFVLFTSLTNRDNDILRRVSIVLIASEARIRIRGNQDERTTIMVETEQRIIDALLIFFLLCR